MARGDERVRERLRLAHDRLLALGTTEHYEDTALYDHEYAERRDDIDWYTAVLAEQVPTQGRVLELGAGTGRITLGLAELGLRVVALDRMPSMLAALKRRLDARREPLEVELVEADMRSLPLPDACVDAAIAPFNTLMHLYTWQDLLACFREVERVLQPGGVFALDVQIPDLHWLRWDREKRHAITRFTHPATGEKLIYSTNHDYDLETQVCHIRIYYDHAPPRGRKFKPPPVPYRLVHLAHRQIFPEELRLLLHVAGLTIERHDADFSDRPLRDGVESQVVVARKPLRAGRDSA